MSPGRFNLSRSRASNQQETFTSKHKNLIQVLCKQNLVFSEKLSIFTTDSNMLELAHNMNSFFLKFAADAERFLSYLPDLFRDESSLRPLLSGISVNNVPSSYSVMKLLLDCEALRTRSMELILQAVVSISEGVMKNSQGPQLCHSLLYQFVFVSEPTLLETLQERLFELVEVCSKEIQMEIISVMPLLVTPNSVTRVGEQLQNLLIRRSALAAPLLDAFMALPLSQELLSSVQDTSLNLMEAVPFETVPVHLKFILQSCPPGERGMELLQSIRVKLSFPERDNNREMIMTSTPFEMPPPSTNCPQNEAADNYDMVVSGIFSTVFQFRPDLAKMWLTMEDSLITQPDGHRLNDIMLLLILLQSQCVKSDLVLTTVRHHIRRQIWVQSLLEEILFPNHGKFCEYHFKSLLQIAENLLSEHTRVPELVAIGKCIYRLCFTHIGHLAEQQEVVAALVTHVGAGVSEEMSAALEVLEELADREVDRMQRFDIFIMGLLDYLDQLSASHVRQLYTVLSRMAFRNTNKTNLQDELFMLIRKQLNHPQAHYKSMGVIGAITMMQHLIDSPWLDHSLMANAIRACASSPFSQSSTSSSIVSSTGRHDESGSSSNSSRGGEDGRTVINLLQMIRQSHARCATVGSLFMDELSAALSTGTLNNNMIQRWIARQVMKDFQTDFVSDNVDASICQRCLALDESTACDVSINVTPLWRAFRDAVPCSAPKRSGVPPFLAPPNAATQSQVNVGMTQYAASAGRIVSPFSLAPHFRLLATCEFRRGKNSLQNIDALLGCPLLLDDVNEEGQSVIQKVSSREVEVEPILLAINWFIEVINAFTLQPQMNSTAAEGAKLLKRLKHIVFLRGRLREVLALWMARNPGAAICLPLARVTGTGQSDVKLYFAANSGGNPAAAKKKKEPKPAKEKPKRKKSKKDNPENQVGDTTSHTLGNVTLGVGEDMESTRLDKCGAVCAPKNMLKEDKVDLNQLNACFRELDLEVHQFLAIEEIVQMEMDSEDNAQESVSLKLEWPEIHFLLEDLARKVDYKMPIRSNKLPIGMGNPGRKASSGSASSKLVAGSDVNFHNVDLKSTQDVVDTVMNLLPHICRILDRASRVFRGDIVPSAGHGDKLHEDASSDSSGSLFGEMLDPAESHLYSECISLVYEILNNLMHYVNKDEVLFSRCVAILAASYRNVTRSTSPGRDPVRQAQQALCYLQQEATRSLPHMACAVTNLQLCQLLQERIPASTASASTESQMIRSNVRRCRSSSVNLDAVQPIAMVQYSHQLLNERWDEAIQWRNRKYRDSLSQLLKMHLHEVMLAAAPRQTHDGTSFLDFLMDFNIRFLSPLCSENGEEELEDDGEPSEVGRLLASNHPTYATLKRSTLSIYYRAVWDALLGYAKERLRVPPSGGKKSGSGGVAGLSVERRLALLSQWRLATHIVSHWKELLRESPLSSLLVAFLKYGRQFLQLLMRDVMPLLDFLLRQHKNEVIKFLKSVQQVTRFMQSLCVHGKAGRDVALASQIPPAKRILESLICRVKLMLTTNQCSEAFWMGNLKNRTLKGEEISENALKPVNTEGKTKAKADKQKGKRGGNSRKKRHPEEETRPGEGDEDDLGADLEDEIGEVVDDQAEQEDYANNSEEEEEDEVMQTIVTDDEDDDAGNASESF